MKTHLNLEFPLQLLQRLLVLSLLHHCRRLQIRLHGHDRGLLIFPLLFQAFRPNMGIISLLRNNMYYILLLKTNSKTSYIQTRHEI